MEILYYFMEQDTIMYKWQRFHIFDELEREGHKITVFNPLLYRTIEDANLHLIKYIKTNNIKFELFMTPHGKEYLYLETLEKIKKLGLPTLLICFDNLIVPYAHIDIADKFDLVWLTSRETKYLFDKWGAKTIFLPYAANPYLLNSTDEKEILKVAFIGTPYGSRVNMINYLIENDIKLSLFASNKNNSNNSTVIPKVNFEAAVNLLKFPIGRKVILGAVKQKIQGNSTLDWGNDNLEINNPVEINRLGNLYSSYALSLSSTSARNTGVLKNSVKIVNLRSFEIPMSGGIQICAHSKELSEYFEEDKEILFYRSNDELIEKSKFYLRSDKECLRSNMKKAARKRSVNDHTWNKRFKTIFSELGLRDK